MFSAAFFIGSDWVWNTWAVYIWIKWTAFGGVDVTGIVVWVLRQVFADSHVGQVSESEGAFNNTSVLSAFVSSVVDVAFGSQISSESETESSVSNSLSIAIVDSVGFGVHFDAFVGVDQVSAGLVKVVDDFSVGENGWSVDQNLVGIPPGVVQVAPATVSVEWFKRVLDNSGEGSTGFVGVLLSVGLDVGEEGSHGSVGEAETGGGDANEFHDENLLFFV